MINVCVYLKFNVPSILAIDIDNNKQATTMASLSTATKGLENVRAASLA